MGESLFGEVRTSGGDELLWWRQMRDQLACRIDPTGRTFDVLMRVWTELEEALDG